MLRSFLRIAYVGLAVAACSVGVFAPGCSSDDNTVPAADASASTGSDDAGLCNDPANTRNGLSCFPTGPTVCFKICNTGGCQCKIDPSNPTSEAGIWSCAAPTDLSCMPDSAPIDDFDGNEPPPFDAGDQDVDAGVDDGGDGGDADAS